MITTQLEKQTLDKRLTTFPENLQRGQTAEAGQEDTGDLRTGTTFFSDILETEEAGAAAPEEELRKNNFLINKKQKEKILI